MVKPSAFFLAIIVLVASCLGADVPRLVARFNATADGRVVDAGPSGIGAELFDGAATAADPARGHCVTLGGGKARVVCKPSEAIDRLTRDFTVAAWVRLDRAPGGSTSPIVTKRPGWWTGKPFSLNARGDGLLEALVNDGSDHWLHGRPLPAGTWSHVALVVDNARATLYQDGVAVAATEHAGRLSANAEPISFGFEQGADFPGGDYRAFPGGVADVVFLATPLSAEQVAALRDGTLATHPATAADLPSRGLLPRQIPETLRLPPPADAPLMASIDFSQPTPKAVGMWFAPTGVEAGTVAVADREDPCWVAKQGSSGQPWERSFRFVLTDPRFRDGRMPAVDVEIEYLSPAWAPVEVVADTAGGSRWAAGGWQATQWRTLRFRIDDAHFGSRDFGTPESARASDGFDLRINGSTSDLYVRAVRIVGHDRVRDPDFRRLLKLVDVTTPGDLFLYGPGEPAVLRYAFTNLALRPVDIAYRVAWERHDGTHLGLREGRARLEAEAGQMIELALPTDGEPLGILVAKAAFERLLPDVGTQPLAERETYLGLASPGKPAKARPGDFLYGLDTSLGPAYRNPRILRWCDELGVDLVRGGLDMNAHDIAAVERSLGTYARHGLQVLAMPEPTWDDDAARRDAETERRARFAGEVAHRFPQVRFWELGNEPDLEFFYKGPIDAYTQGYEKIARAILHANPEALVMNGGLCFVGDDGDLRARRFIEGVAPSAITAWAYHGHGPGARAERAAYERMRGAVRAAGKNDKPLIDTETGFAARARPQELVQAATCVQKFVFAQASGMPSLVWFRLVMSEEDYGTLRGDREPRPAALAYRALVQALRGHRFVRELTLADPAAKAYLFRDDAGGTARVVGWHEDGGRHEALLRLGAESRGTHVRDLFGNRADVRQPAPRLVSLELGGLPRTLCWDGPADVEPAAAVVVGPAHLELEPHQTATLTLDVRNPLATPLAAVLRVLPDADLSVRAEPAELRLQLAPGEQRSVTVACEAGQPDTGLAWPRRWRVFPDAAVDGSSVRTLPRTLPGTAGGEVEGLGVTPRDGTVDFSEIGFPFRERRPAWAVAEVFSEKEQTVRMGASADWWMAWFVNGKPVFDTLADGNGGAQGIDAHVFPVRLNAGRNVLAVQVLSGSQGWNFHVGAPDAVARRAAGLPAAPGLTAALVGEDGQPLGQTRIAAAWVPAVEALEAVRPLIYRDWRRDAPTAFLGAGHIRNPHMAHPDTARWHRGDADLSAEVWLHAVAGRLVVEVAVRDDRHEFSIGDGDAIDVRLRTAEGGVWGWRVAFSPDGTGPQAVPLTDNAPAVEVVGRVEGDQLLYRLTCDAAALGRRAWSVDLVVYDRDDGRVKQTLTWTDPAASGTQPRFRLP